MVPARKPLIELCYFSEACAMQPAVYAECGRLDVRDAEQLPVVNAERLVVGL
jgi:hypothetical protein